MRKNALLKSLVPTLVLFSSQVAALPFQSLDPRSYGMGGTGVASGTSANASFMNPALLAAAHEDEDFSMELPIIGARFMDADGLVDEIDGYQENNLEANFDNALAAFKNNPTGTQEQQALSSATSAMVDQLKLISDKAVQGEFSAGFVVGIPSKTLGVSLTANVWAVGGGVVTGTGPDVALFQDVVDAIAAGNVTPGDPVYDVITAGLSNGGSLQSQLNVRGAVVQEFTIAMAREISIGGQKVAFGVTPKYLKVTTFDYQLDVDVAELDAELGKMEYSDFNVDVGVAKDFASGWKSGFVVKNLIAQEYKTVLGNSVKIEPQARVGVSHSTDWTTVSLDIDLNESEAVGFDSNTQYIALGSELNVFETVQLRIGYRHNMSDSNTSIVTAGIGFSVLGAHVELAAGGNQDEAGGSFQMGFRF